MFKPRGDGEAISVVRVASGSKRVALAESPDGRTGKGHARDAQCDWAIRSDVRIHR